MKRQWMTDARKKNNITQEELADIVGVARGHIAHIENGSRDPSVLLAKKISEVLETEWTLFFNHKSVISQHKPA